MRGPVAVMLTDERVLEVFRLALAGWSAKRIARKYRVHWQYVAHVLQGKARANAHPRHPDRLRWLALQAARLEKIRRRLAEAGPAYPMAARDYRQGHSLRAAAARHGLHWVRLAKWLKNHGIPRRPAWERSPLRG